MNLNNVIIANYSYDSAGRLSSLTYSGLTTTVASFNYTYDAVGNRLSMTDDSGAHSYTYDNKYQLITATHPNQPGESFNYDQVGNRAGGTYDAANRLLDNANYTYTYDNNGNTVEKVDKTSGEVVKFTWNAENQLTELNIFASVLDTVPTTFAKYIYDGMGRRVAKNVDNVIIKYLYDNEDILLELDDNDNVLARYTHGRVKAKSGVWGYLGISGSYPVVIVN